MKIWSDVKFVLYLKVNTGQRFVARRDAMLKLYNPIVPARGLQTCKESCSTQQIDFDGSVDPIRNSFKAIFSNAVRAANPSL